MDFILSRCSCNKWNNLDKEAAGENPEIERKVKLMLKENPEITLSYY